MINIFNDTKKNNYTKFHLTHFRMKNSGVDFPNIIYLKIWCYAIRVFVIEIIYHIIITKKLDEGIRQSYNVINETDNFFFATFIY